MIEMKRSTVQAVKIVQLTSLSIAHSSFEGDISVTVPVPKAQGAEVTTLLLSLAKVLRRTSGFDGVEEVFVTATGYSKSETQNGTRWRIEGSISGWKRGTTGSNIEHKIKGNKLEATDLSITDKELRDYHLAKEEMETITKITDLAIEIVKEAMAQGRQQELFDEIEQLGKVEEEL